MPTVPAASTQRDKFFVSIFISLYLSTKDRAGSIIEIICSPLAKATKKVESIVELMREPVDFMADMILSVKVLKAPVSSKMPPREEIGRASCRERVQMEGVGESGKGIGV